MSPVKPKLTEPLSKPTKAVDRPRMDGMAYDADTIWQGDVASLAELEALLGRKKVSWINIDGLSNPGYLEGLTSIFGFHELALEDAVNVQQRTKVDDYGNYLFIVIRMVIPSEVFETEQLSIFLGRNFVLTVQERPGGDCLGLVRDKLVRNKGRLRSEAADYLVYSIIDAVVDSYFPVLERLGERIEALEDEIFDGTNRNVVAAIHDIKRDVLALRKAVWPLRETLNSLKSETHDMIGSTTRTYLRDCYDHTLRVIDLIEMYRELAHDLMDIHLTTVNNRMNEVMKVLTIITTLFIPPTLIAGIYGMNFDTHESPLNMPELHWPFGYIFSLLLMVCVSAALMVYLYKRGWIDPFSGGDRKG